MSLARVYRDAISKQPDDFTAYNDMQIEWGDPEKYAVVRKIGQGTFAMPPPSSPGLPPSSRLSGSLPLPRNAAYISHTTETTTSHGRNQHTPRMFNFTKNLCMP